ncbi:MAG: gamma-glutamyl-gamma-aminobutyrate hydrolase family protein, partial [Nitrospinae bacterium]|nr:gamma-glutamyl-gamma-aminobutyrate hydrolase family protein [Nitrospinota bacterium]
ASAVSPDGVVESIERRSGSFLMGVQWHPEFLTKTGKQAAIFGALIRAAKGRTRALK